MSVPAGRKNIKDPSINGKQGHIKGPTPQIIHDDVLFTIGSIICIHPMGNCCSSRFIDYSLHLQSSNNSRIFSRLPLSIIEVCRDSDNGALHVVSKVSLSNKLHLLQDHCGDFLRGERQILIILRNHNSRHTSGVFRNLVWK
mmetsp:Transcript_6898/g.20683  ORF Transcript_6898/g.20683 Transcript_6898/m.20683 type:complete len:142 (+) Transcript_6898:3566-3991(+)